MCLRPGQSSATVIKPPVGLQSDVLKVHETRSSLLPVLTLHPWDCQSRDTWISLPFTLRKRWTFMKDKLAGCPGSSRRQSSSCWGVSSLGGGWAQRTEKKGDLTWTHGHVASCLLLGRAGPMAVRLPRQGTRVRALVWEDPTCRGATKPMCHNYWACTLEPTSHNYWACVPQLLKPACLEPKSHNYWACVSQLLKPTRLQPMLRNKKSHHNEKPAHCNEE